MKTNLVRQWEHPSSAYRGKPFWAWNGKLEEPELRRQIRLMHRMGLGGFFMHSRVGLATPYLSPEWFRLIGACVDEAEKLDMEAWLYDEDRWPSGAAGGLVTKNPAYRQRTLVMERRPHLRDFKRTPDMVALFAARIDGFTARGVRRIGLREPLRLDRGETALVFRVAIQPCGSWYNGFTYLDTMNHEAVRAFIRTTHDAYWKHLGRHFGKRIPGIFTDEPSVRTDLPNCSGSVRKPGVLPWTGALPSMFRSRYGYDLAPHLPDLFYDVEGATMSRARYHYHDCVAFLFTDAFSRQIGEWCERHECLFTGHAYEEDTLSWQTRTVGSAMRFYEYMQAPGMDMLTERWRVYDTAKQVSSAAHQFGRTWRLTETYGCTGWDFPLAGHKALGDWQVALGINLRCQHLAWYTMEGEAKRDYPASIFYQSPWWDLYPKVEDYFARVLAVMTQGREVRDVLVIHPVESMWTMCRMGWLKDPAVKAYDRMVVRLRDRLLSAHLDFDYGDEDILSRHGRVSRGKERPLFHVGQAAYTTVVVPPLKTMRRSTLSLLKRFSAAGGRVIFVGAPADSVDAQASGDVHRLAATCTQTQEHGPALIAAVETAGRRVSITDAAGREIGPVLYLLREDAKAYYLFLCNTGHPADRPMKLDVYPGNEPRVRDRNAAFPDVRVRGFADGAGRPLEFNPETGDIAEARAVREQDRWTIQTGLPALGSRLFVVPKRMQARRYPRAAAYREVRRVRLNRARWPVALSEPNVLVMDWPRYRVGHNRWKTADEILRVDSAIRKRLGLAPRSGGMVQPWARKAEPESRRVPFELEYDVDVAELPKGPLCLALEQPRRFRVEVNGVEVPTETECGWWVDLSLKKIPLDPVLFRAGRNVIRLSGDYAADHPGLEAVYLLGEFGVRLAGARPVMTARPDRLSLGDWRHQGLAFYAGSVSYHTSITPHLRKGERLFVQVPSYRGVAIRVRVNGQTAGVAAWDPCEADITDCLAARGTSRLQIDVIGHRRNSHGPLHLDKKWPTWTSPNEFKHIAGPAYQLVPCGLMAPPCLSIRAAR